jgi:hypothetical protein
VLVAAAAAGADRATRERVADHVIACARCAEQLRVLTALTPWVDEHAHLVGGAERGVVPSRVPARWSSAVWSYAAAAVLAVVAVGLTTQVRRLQQENRTLAARMESAVAAAGSSARPIATLEARVAEQQQRLGDLERRLASADAPDANAPIIDLEPSDATRTATRTSKPSEIPAGARTVVFVLNTSRPEPGALYDVDLVAADDRVLWAGSGLKQSADRTLTLVVPRTLVEGNTRLRLFSNRGTKRVLVEQYSVPTARR